MLDRSAGSLGVTVETLPQRVLDDPRLTRVAAEAVDAAARTHVTHKIRALARALASAIAGDTAQIDEDELIIHSLAEMEAAHIKLLYAMSVLQPDEGPRRAAKGFTIKRLQQRLPHLGRPIRALFAPLEAHGCVVREPEDVRAIVERILLEREQPRRGGRPPASSNPEAFRWSVTPHGREVLNYLGGQQHVRAEHRATRHVRLRGGWRDGARHKILPDQPLLARAPGETWRERYLTSDESYLDEELGDHVLIMDFDTRVAEDGAEMPPEGRGSTPVDS
jgi:hypothetical protein